jgi:hypothetical protein
MNKHLRKRIIWGSVLVAAVLLSLIGIRRLWQLGAAADVQEYTPADIDAMLWLPRVDQAAERLLQFTRGVKETEQLRQFLKPETGIDIADPEGLRRVGVDPEAGLVLFSRNGNLYLLFGVEDDEAFSEALIAKFINNGHTGVEPVESATNDAIIYRVPSKVDSGKTIAAFGASSGLMALVYRGRGEDPLRVIEDILKPAGDQSFFKTVRFREMVKRVGDEGPLLYADGHTFARNKDGKPRTAWLERLPLNPLVRNVIEGRIAGYLSRVAYIAARMDMNSCAANIRTVLRVEEGASLIPKSWMLNEDSPSPSFGDLLPRDAVFMMRVGIQVERISSILLQIGRLGSGLAGLGSALGLGDKGSDPIAALLSKHVHPDLADRHIVRDLANHLTGHIAVAVTSMDPRATMRDIMGVRKHPVAAANALGLVLMMESHNGTKLVDVWWPKRSILERSGYTIERTNLGDSTSIRIERGCSNKKRQCERYGVLQVGKMVMVTTGRDTMRRLREVLLNKTSSLRSRTREAVASSVLEKDNMLAGGYLSFDGLLAAVRNRNVPGGIKRYLSQFYEVAFTLDLTGGDADSQLLITR